MDTRCDAVRKCGQVWTFKYQALIEFYFHCFAISIGSSITVVNRTVLPFLSITKVNTLSDRCTLLFLRWKTSEKERNWRELKLFYWILILYTVLCFSIDYGRTFWRAKIANGIHCRCGLATCKYSPPKGNVWNFSCRKMIHPKERTCCLWFYVRCCDYYCVMIFFCFAIGFYIFRQESLFVHRFRSDLFLSLR